MMFKTTILATAALALLATGCIVEDVGDESQESHSWGNFHWARQSNPFTIQLGDNVDDAWQQFLIDASNDWSQSTVLDTIIVAGNTKPRRCNATDGMVEVCNTTYGSTGWLGIAGVYATGDHITKSYVKLNDSYFQSGSSYDTPEWRRFVTCQEVGHAFGLAHQDENFYNMNLDTCMDYTSNPDSNQHPNAHDYEQLEAIYAHLDDFTTVGTYAGGSSTEPEEIITTSNVVDETDLGELIFAAPNGMQEVYIKTLGPDQVLVRHVTWAHGAHLPNGAGAHTH